MADKSATIPINNGLVETVRLVELTKDCVMEIAEAVADVMDARTKENVIRTNADRIRSMTDEELAVLCEDGCPPDFCCPPPLGKPQDYCIECWLEWLKKEVQDG